MTAEPRLIQEIPELPEKSRLGVRRRLSQMGISGFLDRQHEGLQQYLARLLAQVPSLAADKDLQAFFTSVRSRQDEELLQEMLIECRAGINLQSIKGEWQQQGSESVWTVHETGMVLLDGESCGADYDLSERRDGVLLTISRPDGWKVDIERSTDKVLFWYKRGEEDLLWTRAQGADAASSARRASGATAASG